MNDDQPTVPYGYCQCGCGQKAPLAKATASRYGHVKGQPVRYVHNHHRARPVAERLAAKTVVGEPSAHRPDLGPCHVWTGSTNGRGYGTIGRSGRRTSAYVHRIVYELAHGEIPEGLEIDHLCRNRACVNPAHLEAVTHRENLLRGDTVIARQIARSKAR